MWRENRRVQAISWGSAGSSGNGDDPPPPPKPSRVPATLIGSSSVSSTLTRGGKNDPHLIAQSTEGPNTYLVAPNSDVLAQLMRENQDRADAGMYTAPASVFNTYTVEFVHPDSSTPLSSPQHRSKGKNRKHQQNQQPLYANVANGQTPPSLPSSPPPPAPNGTIPAAKRDVRFRSHDIRQFGLFLFVFFYN